VIRDLALLNLDPYLLPLLNGILRRSRHEVYGVLVESARNDSEADSFAELMGSGRIDGMIVENPDYDNSSLYRLVEAGRPIVVLGTNGQKGEFSITSDDREIGRMATDHLIAIGRQRIAHIAYAEAGIYGVDQRLDGYREALHKAGLQMSENLVRHANFSMESGYEAMRALLENLPIPDALFAGSDAIAIGAMAAIKDAGVSIPQEIAVIGVDDIAGSRFCRPSLTTIVNDPIEAGHLAADMLIDLLSGRTPAVRNIVKPSRLVVRGSTGEAIVE
jgi:DNA-binding LacI/PurR family transcriptional regulator